MALGRVNRQRLTLTDGATITATPNARHTTYTVTLAGNRTFDFVVTLSQIGDRVKLIATASAALRTLTLGALQKPTSPLLSVESGEKSIIEYEFDGTNFLELSRSGIRIDNIIVALADAGTITATPNAKFTFFETAALTGDQQLDFDASTTVKGDRVLVSLLCDSTIRTITLGLLQLNSATTAVLVADEKTYIEYMFDGTNFIETSRSISAL